MRLSLKISDVELAFLSTFRRGYSLSYTLRRTAVSNCEYYFETDTAIIAIGNHMK